MINKYLKKIILVIMVMLTLSAQPVTSVLAKGQADQSNPPATGVISNARLEWIWARELRFYERLGWAFERGDVALDRIQQLIDRAAENGKDVTALQATLDAFKAAAKEAHPIYESSKGIVNSHKGFDENGKVTDAAQAVETVKEMGFKFRKIKTAMNSTGKALRAAIKAFRDANRPLQPPFTQDN
jgi:hypothetical protein